MKFINAKLVEDTWQEPENWTKSKIDREHAKLIAEQRDLETFVATYISEYNEEVQGVGLWVFFMVYRMYRKAYEKPIPIINTKKILDKHKDNEHFFETLVDAHEKMINRIAETRFCSQPEVWRYITEALIESNGPEDVELTDDIIGDLFAMFKTIVELLDDATESKINKV